MDLRQAVTDALIAALGEHAEKVGDIERMLSHPPRPEMGDLAFGCFPLARLLKKAPVDIAKELAPTITVGGLIQRAEAMGPFINFFAEPAKLLDWATEAVLHGRFFEQAHVAEPQRIMVEFSQPNTHKTFHVGHLRNVALGDALVQIFKAQGHTVIPVNYYGDFGIDVAKCLWWIRNHPEDKPPQDNRAAWLGDAYTSANGLLSRDKNDEDSVVAEKAARFEEVRTILAGMEGEDPEITALYQQTRKWCLDDFKSVYDWLGVRFDHDFFESEMESPAQAVVDEYLSKEVFEQNDGAIICRLTPKIKTPALVRKSDGTSLYMTWDLALASAKFDQYNIERSLYVVGTEQKFHFQQLFATLSKMGYARAKDCRHVAYELVMLPEGKMSSRNGTAIPLHTLRQSVCDVIAARIDDGERVATGEREETIRRIAVACLKYGMLSVGNTKRVIFNLDDWVNPLGDTGAYLLYSVARIAGIFRKASLDIELTLDTPSSDAFGEEAERALLGHLLQYPATIGRASEACDPSIIAGFAYEGARLFNRFFGNCPILAAEGDLKEARLRLSALTHVVLSDAFRVLGIQPVAAM